MIKLGTGGWLCLSNFLEVVAAPSFEKGGIETAGPFCQTHALGSTWRQHNQAPRKPGVGFGGVGVTGHDFSRTAIRAYTMALSRIAFT